MLKAQTLGLVIFAGEAFVQCPPTIDYSAFRLFLDVADVGMISDTGTNIEDAIEESMKLLDDDSPVDKAIPKPQRRGLRFIPSESAPPKEDRFPICWPAAGL